MPPSISDLLHQHAERGDLSPPALERALELAEVLPSAQRWRLLLDRLLLIAGAVFLVLGVLFFFAFNWDDIGRLGKLAVGQAALLIALGFALWRGVKDLSGKMALFCACFLTGVVLAIFGQVYQTGADPWQLFATWAALILPWAIVGRFSGIWVLWVAVVNVAISLYWQRWGWFDHRSDALFLTLALFNLSALIVWEWGQQRGIDWLAARWPARLLAATGLFHLSVLAIIVVFSKADHVFMPRTLTLLLYPALLVGMYLLHRLIWRDLFVLTLCALSQIVVVTCAIGHWLFEASRYHAVEGIFLLLAALVVGQSAFWAVMLRKIQQEDSE
jgi:uncharacterized membrane protein